jgi:sigma-E factor negative regulatory protein RseC
VRRMSKVNREQGVVIEVEGDMVKIQVGRHSDCTNCGACPASQHIIIDAVNKPGAKKGQRVAFEVRETSVLKGAFMVFVLPLLAAALGAFLGWQAGGAWGYDLTYAAVIGAVLVFVLSLGGVKLFDRSVAGDQSMKPVVVEILS